MFAKIALVILSLGVCACTLLALRQARLEAANELAMTRLRVRRLDERISQVRTKIAPLVTPQNVERMIRELHDTIGPLEPITPLQASATPPTPQPSPVSTSRNDTPRPRPAQPATMLVDHQTPPSDNQHSPANRSHQAAQP